jgi:hypothetical protein
MQQCRCFVAPCVRAHEAFWRRLCASTYISHSFCHMKRAQIRVARARCVSLRALSHLDSRCGGALWLTSGSLYSNCNAVIVVDTLTACISDVRPLSPRAHVGPAHPLPCRPTCRCASIPASRRCSSHSQCAKNVHSDAAACRCHRSLSNARLVRCVSAGASACNAVYLGCQEHAACKHAAGVRCRRRNAGAPIFAAARP